jgi:hypothetical protein
MGNSQESMIKPNHIFLFVISLLLCSCGGLSSTPKPEESRYMKAGSGGVLMSTEKPKPFTNNFDFTVKSSAPELTYATIQYQSLDGSANTAPVEKDAIKPGQKVSSSSAPFARIKKDTNYYVKVQLYNDPARENLIDTLDQPIRFSMPAKVIKAFGMDSRVD